MHPAPTRYGNLRLAGLFVVSAWLALSGFQYGQNLRAEEAPEKSPWSRSAGLGFTWTEGNSQTLLLSANIRALRKKARNELSLGADALYGEDDGTKNTEKVSGYSQYNRLFGAEDRWFGYARLDALHDAVADVEYRITFGPGLGYYLIKKETTELNLEAGPSFVYEKVGDQENAYAAGRAAEHFTHKFNDRVRMWQDFEILTQMDEAKNFIINAEIGVEASLTEAFSVRTYIQDTYDNEPAPGRKPNDVKFVTGVAYKF